MPKLHLVLLFGICLCVCGTPVHPRSISRPQDGASSVSSTGVMLSRNKKSEPSDAELVLNAGVAVGPHGRPEGIDPAMQTENGDSFDGVSGPSEAGGEARSHRGELKKVESASEVRRAEGLSDVASVQSAESESAPEATSQLDMDVRVLASSTVIPPPSTAAREGKDRGGKERRRRPGEGDPHRGKGTDTRSPSSEPLNPAVHFDGLTSQSPALPSASTLFTIWGSDGATVSPLPDPLLPEIGPNLMPKEDGPESLWTEAARPGGADTVVPLAQDEATEGTMSSEALPLIFEPFEDVTPEGAAAAAVVRLMPGSVQPPAAMATKGMHLSEADLDQLVTVETDSDGPSHAQPLLMPDWTSPWQTSGAELLDSISSAGPSVSQRHHGTESEDRSERVAVRKPNLKDHLPTTGSSLSSLQHAMTTVTMATPMPVHKSRSGLEEMESEEERDEDDNDDEENSEESVEEESEEDQTETPKTSPTSPPYSFIPPPPVWVQRNQGLMRGWVELIREKAGYVSGMLAPVGIGITGALLIVGALYSIRMIHRKRRNSFKHQRRKVRQPEQPRETSTSRQDQAMLLADSSEDEF